MTASDQSIVVERRQSLSESFWVLVSSQAKLIPPYLNFFSLYIGRGMSIFPIELLVTDSK